MLAEAQTLHVGPIHPDIQPEISSALLRRPLRENRRDATNTVGVDVWRSQEKQCLWSKNKAANV